jgi:hypothetical protein
MKDQLKGCHFREAEEIEFTLKTAMQVMCGGFQKCFEQFYEYWQMSVAADIHFWATVPKGFKYVTEFEIWLLSQKFMKLPHMAAKHEP